MHVRPTTKTDRVTLKHSESIKKSHRIHRGNPPSDERCSIYGRPPRICLPASAVSLVLNRRPLQRVTSLVLEHRIRPLLLYTVDSGV